MRYINSLVVLLIVLGTLGGASAPARALRPVEAGDDNGSLLFVENVGQFHPDARFQVRGAGATLWLAEDALWITLAAPPDEGQTRPTHGVHLWLSFPGANPHPRLEPFDRQDVALNYYRGNDPAQWHTRVPAWGGVRYVDLYPGVDLRYEGRTGALKYTFTVAPGADPTQIRLAYEGADGLRVDERGDLLIRAADGSISQWMPAGASHFIPRDAPLAQATLCDLETFTPRRLSDEELDFLHQEARRLHRETDYAIFGWFGGSLFEGAQFARGWVNLMMDLKRNPDFVAALVKKLAEAALTDLARYLDAVGPYVDVVGFGDDFGTQSGLQISPTLYRRFFAPYHRQLYGMVHARSDAFVFLHSCGSVYALIPDFIDIGVDVLNPVQTSATQMEPARLKQEFGERLTFWGGGACPQHMLPRGTPEEVAADVEQRLQVFAPGGGYVFAPIHDLLPDVAPQNIIAMYDTARHFRYR